MNKPNLRKSLEVGVTVSTVLVYVVLQVVVAMSVCVLALVIIVQLAKCLLIAL